MVQSDTEQTASGLRSPTSEPSAEELLALANRIDGLPAYSGTELNSRLYQSDMPESTATRDDQVILINEKWRAALVRALHVSAPSGEASEVSDDR